MAKAKLNPVFVEVHGKLGDMVLRRTRNGGVSLIRKVDMSKMKWSQAQQANRQRFREAVAYAKKSNWEWRREVTVTFKVTVTYNIQTLELNPCNPPPRLSLPT